MSVDSVSGPNPAYYSYPSSLPSALTAPVSSSSTSTTPATSATSTSASATPISSYQAEFDTLQQDDAAELLQVSLGSTANAQSNLASVLAQAAALQGQQQAAQQAQAGSVASSSSASDPLNLPTLQSLFDQSDSDAGTNLSNYQSSGSSIDLLA
jgi:hypothetical protein